MLLRLSVRRRSFPLPLSHKWVALDRPVGFQNSATASDQRFQAAGSYSLMSPPRTGRRRILPWARSGTGPDGRAPCPVLARQIAHQPGDVLAGLLHRLDPGKAAAQPSVELAQVLLRLLGLYHGRSGRLMIFLRHNMMIIGAAALVTPSPSQDHEVRLPYWATGENTYALLARTDVAAFQVKLTRGGSSGWAIRTGDVVCAAARTSKGQVGRKMVPNPARYRATCDAHAALSLTHTNPRPLANSRFRRNVRPPVDDSSR